MNNKIVSSIQKSIFWFLSKMFQLVVYFRNKLFDYKILPTYKSSALKTIGVGNLSVGGTGKTPLSSLIISILQDNKTKTHFVSRGYGRKTKGLIKAESSSTASDIGDEPLLIFLKWKNAIEVWASEKRINAIKAIEQNSEKQTVVVLDDNFQHRSIKVGLQFLLTTFHQAYWNDQVLPLGRLREPKANAKRADYLVVSKCPSALSKSEALLSTQSSGFEENKIFFSSINYANHIKSVFGNESLQISELTEVMAFCGIAKPLVFSNKIEEVARLSWFKAYKDHENYSKQDFLFWKQSFENLMKNEANLIILTTEKDAMRLLHHAHKNLLYNLPLYYWSIETAILFNQENEFKNIINSYVKSNK